MAVVLCLILTADSNVLVAAKAQHDPQLPWSLIGVKLPLTFLQSKDVGTDVNIVGELVAPTEPV